MISRIDYSVPRAIISDESRVIQILNNLVSNAIKFTYGGTVELNLFAEKKENDQHELTIEVKDTGIGIPESKMKDLFESFTQVDSSLSRTYEGAGLGLAICKKLTELMNGSISVKSVEGEGSCFTVKLPVQATVIEETEETSEALEPTLDGTLADELPLSILVAEDNMINQRLALFVLNRLGYDADLAKDGLEACSP